MRPLQIAIIAGVVGVGFAIGYGLRGEWAPGIVGGVLATILLYLAITRFQEQQAARREARSRRQV